MTLVTDLFHFGLSIGFFRAGLNQQNQNALLTGRIAISLGVVGVIAATLSGLLFTLQAVNPGCGGLDSGFPVPWIYTPQGCPPGWSTDTTYAWPFLALDALFYMGVGYAVTSVYQKLHHPIGVKGT